MRQSVELRQQLDARRLERLAQRALDAAPLVLAARMGDALAGGRDGDTVDIEFVASRRRKRARPSVGRSQIGLAERRRTGARRDFAAARFEAILHLAAQPVGVAVAEQRRYRAPFSPAKSRQRALNVRRLLSVKS